MASAGAGAAGAAPSGRGSGPGSRARLAASAASAWRVPIRPARPRASSPKTSARSDCERARPASCLRAGALRGLERRQSGAALAQRGAAGERGRSARLRTGGEARRCARPRRGASRCGGGFRAWSRRAASGRGRRRAPSRAGPTPKPPGRRVIVCKAAVSRITGPCRSARRARCSAWSAAISAIRRSAAVRSASAASIRAASASAAARARSASLTARRACSSSCW